MARKQPVTKSSRPVGHTKDAGWQIGVRRTIAAPADALWARLVAREGLALWLGARPTVPLGPGRRYALEDATEGEVRVWRPGQQLRLTRRAPGQTRPSTVQLRLLPASTGTIVAWHEDHLSDAAAREARRVVYAATLDALRSSVSA